MSETVATLNLLIATGGIALFFASSVVIVDMYGSRVFEKIIKTWGMLFALVTVAGASTMTLVYSEVFGFIPCGLCWMQRIFLYPQFFILVIAIVYKDKIAPRYGLVLSGIGLIVSLYQHYLQMGGSEFTACPTAGGDCAKRILFEYGFVTFPLLSAFLFIFLIVLYMYIVKINRK